MSKTTEQRLAALEQQTTALVQRVNTLEGARPGRKAKPMVSLRVKGVCAIDPTRDSATCPDHSIFRYQKGCHGTACLKEQQDAYERRKTRKELTEAKPVKVSNPRKRSKQAAKK